MRPGKVARDRNSRILSSHWLSVVTWSEHWPLIGQHWSVRPIHMKNMCKREELVQFFLQITPVCPEFGLNPDKPAAPDTV